MRVVVLGAGVIGVTTAWALSTAGHEVVVIERREGPALETSFANGGQLSVSHGEPWANPEAPFKILQSLGREDAPLLWRMRADAAQWAWGWRFLLQCLPQRTRRNVASLLSLGLYSRAALAEVRAQLGFDYHQLQRGILHFYTDPKEFQRARRQRKIVAERGAERFIKSAEECLEIEPALRKSSARILGGSYSPEDESGDAHLFCEQLARACEVRGVTFQFGMTVTGLETRLNQVCAVRLANDECINADAVVVALGCQSVSLLKPLGLSFPIYPLKGYSASIPIPDGALAPYVSLTDEAHKMVFSRLGNRLRVAGTAEFTGYDTGLTPARCEALVRRTRQIFPDLSTLDDVEFWAGLRPATPGNVPFIGATAVPNLWLNSGHGTLGWTLACGSAKLLTHLIDGSAPGIDPAPYQAHMNT